MRPIRLKEKDSDKRVELYGTSRMSSTVLTFEDDEGVLAQVSLEAEQLESMKEWIEKRLKELKK